MGTGYITYEGTQGNYASIPDPSWLAGAVTVTTIVRLRLADWDAAVTKTYMAQWIATGNNKAILSQLKTGANRIQHKVSNDGSTAETDESNSAFSFTDTEWGWIKTEWSGTAGTLNYFTSVTDTSDPDSVSWSALGTQDTSATASLANSASPLLIMAESATIGGFAADIGYLQMTVDGTLELDADFSSLTAGEITAAEFVEDSANAATVSLVGSDWVGVAGGAPTASCAVTGTAGDGATEAEIVAGGETIILTLTSDTWVATVGADNAITTALIAGLDSAGSEAAGWDAVVKAGLAFGDVARTSDTVVTITLPAFPTYAITANETVTATVPASAVTLAAPIVAAPTIVITNETPTAAASGTAVVGGTTEVKVVTGGETIIVTLTGAQFVATIGADNAITDAFIAGIDSNKSEAAGWDAVVKAGLAFGDVARTSDTVVTVTLPAFPTYAITANETITITVPDTAILNQSGMVAAPTFNVVATPTGVTSPRKVLAAAFQAAVDDGVTVYASPPEVPAVPSVVIRPADPYQAPATAAGPLGAAWAFEVDIILGRWRADFSLDNMEVFRETLTSALPAGWRWVEFGDIGETIINKKAYLRATLAVATISTGGLAQYG